MNPDGISYIDLAEATMSGGAGALVNGYWSPLYPLLLSGLFSAMPPSPDTKFAIVHLLNFGIFVFALLCFEALASTLLRLRVAAGDSLRLRLSLRLLAYALFAYASFILIGIDVVTPDLLLSGFFYLSSALLLLLHQGRVQWFVFAMLGATLGLGYLTKAAMAPLSVVSLAVVLAVAISQRATKRHALGLIIASVVFASVTAPWIVALSRHVGRVTFGETGRLNYAWWVNGVETLRHWQGGDVNAGKPLHPTRALPTSPTVYEFATPVSGSYPVWYEPSYWYDGVRTSFSLVGQAKAMFNNGRRYVEWFSLFIPGIAVFALFAATGRLRVERSYWLLLLPSVAGLLMYAAVYIDKRHVGAFAAATVILIAAAGVAGRARREVLRLTLLVAFGAPVVLRLCYSSVDSLYEIALRVSRPHTDVQAQRAGVLRRMELGPGAPVGLIGSGFVAYWANLGQYRIIAEVADWSAFWAASTRRQSEVLEHFRRAGVAAVIADTVPPWAPAELRQRISAAGVVLFESDDSATVRQP